MDPTRLGVGTPREGLYCCYYTARHWLPSLRQVLVYRTTAELSWTARFDNQNYLESPPRGKITRQRIVLMARRDKERAPVGCACWTLYTTSARPTSKTDECSKRKRRRRTKLVYRLEPLQRFLCVKTRAETPEAGAMVSRFHFACSKLR